mmetsp:Transcript_68500/g.173926  ORF Transcript_68500/g.173926 Transcript_68500/m.173926 type:complete len:104 (+) Transcript_68500:126-437(+)
MPAKLGIFILGRLGIGGNAGLPPGFPGRTAASPKPPKLGILNPVLITGAPGLAPGGAPGLAPGVPPCEPADGTGLSGTVNHSGKCPSPWGDFVVNGGGGRGGC